MQSIGFARRPRLLALCALFVLSLSPLVTRAFSAVTATGSQGIDRRAVVTRHNPLVTGLDSLSSLTVGNGNFAFTVDATGLQTFPLLYRHGVCLGTFSNWAWHSFPNTQHYREEEAWVARDFGRGHTEWYAAQFSKPGRQHDAANYLRQNPHRLHLGNLGLDLSNPDLVNHVHEQLDAWTGTVTSQFMYGRQRYSVQTVCAPDRDLVATRVSSSGSFSLLLRFAYPTGGHSDDGCDWQHDALHSTTVTRTGSSWLVRRVVDGTTYYVLLHCKGRVELSKAGANSIRLHCPGGSVQLQCEFLPGGASLPSVTTSGWPLHDFAYWQASSARSWESYWRQGGFMDFGQVADPRARELERRVVLSQYLMRTQECGDVPPQETGLTYNSWFGKFHLEMTWWHLAHYALWGRAQLLDRPLSWYLQAAGQARAIAKRQGFKGIRWMKMTDPSAAEAPSNVGSYLIWQQPHLIYLAELLYRAAGRTAPSAARQTPTAAQQALLSKYGGLVDQTATFMADFARRDSASGRYVLSGCIPAQETLKADSTVNPPFELNYWHTALLMAQQWREREGKPRQTAWDSVAGGLPPLAYNADSLYLAAASATNTYTDRRMTSDHPALLGALGVLPHSRLTDDKIMKRTADWIWQHWNWPTAWGWDFPMTAMTYARLGEPQRAVDALLMHVQKNTYLPNGHNYQDGRLRIYLPGNGGLLTAVAMMAAGWDGCARQRNPGFPPDWDVRWEGLLPMP